MLKLSVVLEEVGKFDAARMDFAPQTVAEMEAYARMLHEACEDLTEADFHVACKAYRKANRKWPSPAAVVELAPVTMRRAAAALEAEVERSVDWWPLVQRAIGSAGRNSDYGDVRENLESKAERAGLKLTDEAWESIELGIKACGGIRTIANSPTEAPWLAVAFKKAARAQREAEHVHVLADERERRKRLPHGNPKRIGGD